MLWQPSEQAIAHSHMAHFIAKVNEAEKTNINDYADLYQWSIQYPELFWPMVWQYCGVIASKPPEEILIRADEMPGAQWFVGAELNFAENLLRRRDDKIALIFQGENGARTTLTYAELYKQVQQLASALRKAGVAINDRVAGWMPNCPETIIAMLATTSIGAIWSSCSPDFGVEGVLDRFGQIKPKILFTVDGYYYNGKTHDVLEKLATLQPQLADLQQIIVLPFVTTEPCPQRHPEQDCSGSKSHGRKNQTSLSPGSRTVLSGMTDSGEKIHHAKLYQDFLDSKPTELVFAQLPFDHPLYIMYSSGTTGKPKCIVHGAGGTLLQHLKELVLHTDLHAEDTIFYYTTCGWMMWNWFVSSLAVGATLILYDGSPFHPNDNRLFDLIDQEKITVFGTGAKYIATLEKNGLAPNKTHNLASLRCILSSASPLLPENFEYVYQHIKTDLCLSSISGGTDIISCFALGNPILPVYSGEIQCRGLGMKVAVFDAKGKPVIEQKGELVCTAPFPSMPIYFWHDADGEKYHKAYFEKFPNVWAHNDYAEITAHGGMIIYGRSDTVLNPGGVRIGTAEIYRQVESIDEVIESVVVGQAWQNDTRVILFVKLRNGLTLDQALKDKIKQNIRTHTTPRHVPAKIIQVADVPKTINGKLVEIAVRDIIHNHEVKNIDSIANPESLNYFKNLTELTE